MLCKTSFAKRNQLGNRSIVTAEAERAWIEGEA
jgi:hypothetical protein